MPDLKFDLSGIKPLLGQLGLGQAPAPPTPINDRPAPPLAPPPTPAQAGFTAYSADPRNQQSIANSLTMPGQSITPPNVPPASPLSSDPTPAPPNSMTGIRPLSQFPGTSFAPLNTPANVSPLGSFSSPASPKSSLYGGGDDETTSVEQRAFPNPVTAASGLDKLVAHRAMQASNPGPFLVPPASNPKPLNIPPTGPSNNPPSGPYNPPTPVPLLPQAAASISGTPAPLPLARLGTTSPDMSFIRPLGQSPFADVKRLAGYAAPATPTQTMSGSVPVLPPAAMPNVQPLSPGAPSGSGPMKLLPYQNKLQTDQAELQRQQTTGSGVSQIKNPFLRALARTGDVAASIVNPNIAAAIPGTTYHHDQLMAQQGQRIQGDRQDIQDVTGAKQAAANLAHTTAETADIGTKSQQQAARYGLKSVTDDKGNTTLVPDADSPYYKQQQDKDTKLQAQTQLISAQIEDTKAQKELRDAQTAFNNAKTDPNSAIFRQTQQRLAIAQQNAGAASVRAKAYMGNYMQHAYNTGLDGQTLAGAPVISDDNGNQVVVGSTNAPLAVKNNANAAQFNDVHGALDSVEQAGSNLVQSGGRLNSPGVAAALAQPKGTLEQWLQGAGVKANLSPTERAYVQAIAAAHENVQALRKSAGGTATDSAVAKLDAMIPGASTPDLNYLMGQTGQIRQTAERLGKGATVATGGLTVRGQGNGGNASPSTGGKSAGSITVQIPGYPPGQIHASQKDKFLHDNPSAKVVTSGR